MRTLKAGATALVLIAGAAVVLWYGNTLNSWVLGGLIGGLAALLLSIPISLMLFSALARRHDERLREEAQVAVSFPHVDHHPEMLSSRVVSSTSYEEQGPQYLPAESYDEAWQLRAAQAVRNLPAPAPSHRLPVASERQHTGTSLTDRLAPSPSQMQGKSASGRRITRKICYPGIPGYETGSSRSLYQSAALRAARQEVARQFEGTDIEEIPTHLSRRPVSRSLDQALPEWEQRAKRPSRQLPPPPLQPEPRQSSYDTAPSGPSEQPPNMYPRRPRQRAPNAPNAQDEHTTTTARLARNPMPQTDYLNRPGQFTEMDEQDLDLPATTGSLQRPLLRRAPYMYEDDPLREELARQFDGPITRRSSRLEVSQQEDDTE
ncbi:MAG: hypothetical protein IMW89_01060 [Ktedonobacteraceae bacterium]|nr:hypothetical protein [Ktedonobacteraceae bacterium]